MNIQVISICGGVGFPFGMATTQTIVYIATALKELGASTTVLHCGPHPTSLSEPRSGEHKGTPYRYLGISTRRPKSATLRSLWYFSAYMELAYRLVRLRAAETSKVSAVCLYVQGSFLNLYAGALCTLLGLPIIIESCEWGPGIPGTSFFEKWIYRQVMFRFCAGAIVISSAIENRIKELPIYRRHPFPICRRTVLVDPAEFGHPYEQRQSAQPTLVWCGDVSGYLLDVQFLTTVLAKLKSLGHECVLEIVGFASDEARSAIESHARKEGVLQSQLHLLGYVTRPELLKRCGNATVLLQPLRNDVRSRARFPNKLGEYLMSARPVVTSSVGEVGEYLTDSLSAMFYKQGDSSECAKTIATLIESEDVARSVGLAGRLVAESRFSYRAQGPAFLALFGELAR